LEDKIHSFESLECWKDAKEIQIAIYNLVKVFPENERYRLTDQMIRCSRSITNNIAEGYGRFHYLDNAKFCRNSRGSLMELLDHLIIANDCGYINDEKLESLRKRINKCNALLNGYIRYLLKAKNELE